MENNLIGQFAPTSYATVNALHVIPKASQGQSLLFWKNVYCFIEDIEMVVFVIIQ